MPIYYFHVVNNRMSVDTQGTECASLEVAKEIAVRAAGEMIREHGADIWRTGRWSMFVTDQQSNTCLTLTFRGEDLSVENGSE